MLDVLEHIKSGRTLSLLSRIKDFMKDDGCLIISIPIGDSLKDTSFICPNCSQLINPNGHVRQYTRNILMNELKLMGYIVKEECVSKDDYIIVKSIR